MQIDTMCFVSHGCMVGLKKFLTNKIQHEKEQVGEREGEGEI